MSNGSETSSTMQRLLIGAATLIVIILTVAAAIFLAIPRSETSTVSPTTPTTLVQLPPSATVTLTPPTLIDTATPSATSEQPVTPAAEQTDTPTAIPPTSTDTPAPPSPTPAVNTPTRSIIVVTATPVPATFTPDPCAPPQGWVEYVVRPGDTLSSLAQKVNIGPTDLQQINCLASSVLKQGQTINLPFIPPEATVTNTTTPLPSPTSTRPSTPTPIAPIIDEVDARDVATNDPAVRQIVVIALGRNFRPREAGFKAELTGPTLIRLDVDLSSSNTSVRATKLVSESLVTGLEPGTYDLIITNPDGRSDIASGVYPAGTPTPTPSPPEIFSFSPSSGPFDEDIPLTITGENFIPQDIKVQLQRVNGGETFDLEVESATSSSVRAIIEANTLTPDNYFVIVINRDSGTDIADNKYIATN
ncbi:MAG: LysM peptidoglycan-binding domain-containing protein [Anaerolineaceae bacterium]|nr:LysM peptidoglycan-binding domain-containing protein [Anaerolineaceae bacterium]MCB9099443.1 LysM peptidoglycan-binding domain-containing protein [Anaerolineales bacterium]